MKLSTILDQIDLGTYALPEFQRGYVWSREQVRKLMNSLYRGYPIGSLLIWLTKTESTAIRGNKRIQSGTVSLILDGQQRITSLYGIIRGKAPKFFDGNENAFTGLYFNIEDETFEFYMAGKMKDDPNWIDVTNLMRENIGDHIKRLMSLNSEQTDISTIINKLTQLTKIKEVDLHVHEVSGDDTTLKH